MEQPTKKNFFKSFPFVMGSLGLFVLIVLLVGAHSAPATQNMQTDSSASWHTAYSYSGKTDVKTPVFAMQGSHWRIIYSCSVVSKGAALWGKIASPDGSVYEDFATHVDCPAQNTTYAYSKPAGQYYLDIGSVNAGYTFTVEDYY